MTFYDEKDFLVICSFFVFHFNRGKYFQWTTDHDVMMCREVLVSEPYKFKPRTPERGQSWESVAQQLNSIHQPSFRVTARSVRDRLTLLSTKYAQKLRMEEKASGIDVEQTELESLLEEILEREKEAKKNLELKDRDKKSKVEKEKATAEEVRKQALERMAKPKVEDQENKQKKPKVRRSTAEAIDYLRERSDNETDYKKQELEVSPAYFGFKDCILLFTKTVKVKEVLALLTVLYLTWFLNKSCLFHFHMPCLCFKFVSGLFHQ